jgi:multiple sugar transport system substrate-binding protein
LATGNETHGAGERPALGQVPGGRADLVLQRMLQPAADIAAFPHPGRFADGRCGLTTTPAETPQATVAVTPTPPSEMTIWLPPEFDPSGESRAAQLLRERLAQFETDNQVHVDVRLKAASGPSSLLESLSAASAAAPMALPAVIALPRPDMESAALKGLLTPLDGLSTAIDDPDWYDYARELALVQGVTFGLPFAGDGLVLVYRPAKLQGSLDTWNDLLALKQPVGFPAASQLALTTVALYDSVGGEVEDSQRRPILQPEKLASVLELYRTGALEGLFPLNTTQYETDAQVWQAYLDGRLDACLAWTSTFLQENQPDSMLAPLPKFGDQPSTIATGWVWSIADPLPERRAISASLVEWLSDPSFLADWSEAAGVLPTRPVAMAAWQDQTLKSLLGQAALSASARPSTDLITSLGPVLEEAAVKVISLQAEPSQAAAQAAERLTSPQTR